MRDQLHHLQLWILIVALITVVLFTPCYLISWAERGGTPLRPERPPPGGAAADTAFGNGLGEKILPVADSLSSGSSAGEKEKGRRADPTADGYVHSSDTELAPSAPPLDPQPLPPPPSYNEAVYSTRTDGGPSEESSAGEMPRARPAAPMIISGPNDLEWHQVFDAFNEKRMAFAAQWAPPPKSARLLKKRLEAIDDFTLTRAHPVDERRMYKFLKSFNALTNLVYAQSGARRINTAETASPTLAAAAVDNRRATGHWVYRDKFVGAFRTLVDRYAPKAPVLDRVVPFGYDWFMFTGRMTYAIVNAHIALCTVDAEDSPRVRPYYTDNTLVDTRTVANALRNLCANFAESLGYARHGSNRVYVGAAFLYARLLEKACDRITAGAHGPGGLLPDYLDALNEILRDPANRYDAFDATVAEIGKSEVPPTDPTPDATTRGKRRQTRPKGAEASDVSFDGVYDDRTFIAHRRLRMYSYLHPYCEQLLSLQLLLRANLVGEEKLAALLSAVEPMSDEDALFYFDVHSRKGAFKYRNGSALFAALGIARFASGVGGAGRSDYGRVYVADIARTLFVQSGAFTFHAVGQLSDLAFGEIDRANRDLMPAWLMGQRPLYRAERNALIDVPCGAHLEPCVIDTGKSADLRLALIGGRNTTNYVPTEASSAVAAFEEQRIGAVFTRVLETNMDVRYSRCTVATPYYTCTSYFCIARSGGGDGVGGSDRDTVRLSCYTGCAGPVDAGTRGQDDGEKAGRETQEGENTSPNRSFDFKHCTVRLFAQTSDGADYAGESVAVHRHDRVEKRPDSKSKYASDELTNVSLSFAPYGCSGGGRGGGGGDSDDPPRTLRSITVLNRPKSSEAFPVPASLAGRDIVPRVTLVEEGVYRVRVDSRYAVYCDVVRNVLVLLDLCERRACVAPVCSSARDNGLSEAGRAHLLERASATVQRSDAARALKYDTHCKDRVYAYFEGEEL